MLKNCTEKIMEVIHSVFSAGWAVALFHSVVYNLLSLFNNELGKPTASFWALMLGYAILAVSLVVCLIKVIIRYFKKREYKYYILWTVLNAVGICLIPDTYSSILWYQLLGELCNNQIINVLNPLISSEFYCVITMLNMLAHSNMIGKKQ